MSGLENFQKDADWRKNIANHLTAERRLPTPPRAIEKRYPVSVVEDFRKIAEERKVEGVIPGICEQTVIRCRNEDSDDASNESFEILERMCDKTGTDPNSTLFQYLHSNKKDSMIAQARSREFSTEKMTFEEEQCSPAELTQLEDIEAPSRFWDNTMLDAGSAQTSPVKHVGLFRPSTILEESEENSINKSTTQTDANSSNYETANGTASPTGNSIYEIPLLKNMHKSSEDIIEADLASFDKINSYLEKDKTNIGFLHEFSEKCSISNISEEDSVIEVSDDEDSYKQIDNEMIPCSDDNKENESLKFDNTMEEVNYMMKKGQELMALVNNKEILEVSLKRDWKSNDMHHEFRKPPANRHNRIENRTSKYADLKLQREDDQKMTSNIKLPHQFEFEMKTNPRENFFKAPMRLPVHAGRPKEVRQPFAHIISPVRAYRQKTGTTPLMVTVKNKLSRPQFTCSSNLEELNYETKFVNKSNSTVNSKRISGIPITFSKLPKRAYISSEYRHVTDERTKLTIPGGQKIHKYLRSVTAPHVMRHDGKMHLLYESEFDSKTSRIPRPNQSLADLSLMSGDVSMYTLRDAQKF